MLINPEQIQPFTVETAGDPSPADDDAAGFGIGARWRNTATNQIFIKAGESGPGNAIWRRDSVDLPAETTAAFDAFDLAGGQEFDSTVWTTVLWDTITFNTGDPLTFR